MRFALVSVGVAVVAIGVLAISGPAYRMGLPLQAAFGMLRWGAYIGIAATLAALIAGLLAYRRGSRLATVLCVFALIGGLSAFAIPYRLQMRARNVPRIHDITTDLENPPAFQAVVPLRADAPNTLDRSPQLAALQREGYPDLGPITLSVPRDQAFDRALGVAQQKGWEIVTADKAAGRIEATDTTRWFGFKDDIVVRLTPWGAGTRVDARSVSRVGLSDIGTNAGRIKDFLESLQ